MKRRAESLGSLKSVMSLFVVFALLLSLVPTGAIAAELSVGESAGSSVSSEPLLTDSEDAEVVDESPSQENLGDSTEEAVTEDDAEEDDSADGEADTNDISQTIVNEGNSESSMEEDEEGVLPENSETSSSEGDSDEDEGVIAQSEELLALAAASSEDDASTPNSVVTLGTYKPGTYTVTANIYVPSAENTFVKGIQAFLTNPINPIRVSEDGVLGAASETGIPRTHVESNATLVVSDNGELTLTVPVRNPVFTLQGINSGDGVEVTGTTKLAVDLGRFNSDGTIEKVSYTSRINSVTVRLTKGTTVMADGNNGYRFGSCSEYATLLDEDGSVTLALAVGFDNVPVLDTASQTPKVASGLVYNGYEQQGVELGSNTEIVEKADETAIAKNAGDYSVTVKPKDGCLWSDSGTNEERTYTWSIAKAKLTKKFFKVVENYGTYTQAPSEDDVLKGTVYEGFVGEDNENNVEGLQTRSFAGWDADFSQGVLTKVDYPAIYSGEDADTQNYSVTTSITFHVSMSYSDMPTEVKGLVYNGQSQIGLATASGGSWKDAPWDDISDGVYGFLTSRTCIDAGTYTVNLSPHWITLNLDPQGYWIDTLDQSVKTFSWTIAPAPLTAKANDVYYVLGGNDYELSCSVEGFVNGETAYTAKNYVAPTVNIQDGLTADQLEAGKSYSLIASGGSAANYSFSYETGTLYVLEEGQASEPQLNHKLSSYTGTSQQGVLEGIGYTLSTTDSDGNTYEGSYGTNAGEYKTVATLKDGYVWSDGSTETTKTYTWKIEKAPLTAKVEKGYGTKIDEDAGYPFRQNVEVSITGFVNGETEKTAADFVAPTLYIRSDGVDYDLEDVNVFELGFSGDMIYPKSGSAKNYYFSSYKGKYCLFQSSPLSSYPKVLGNLVYNGLEQTGVVKRSSCELTGVTGIEAGTYFATATLDISTGATKWWNVTWTGENVAPDAKTLTAEIQWSIAKAPLSVSATDVTVNYGMAPNLGEAYTLSGFVNGESVQDGTVEGFEAPVVTVDGHEGDDLSSLEPGKYLLRVSGGSADNYEFTGYTSATLTVLAEDSTTVADPQANSHAYNGTAQQGVQSYSKWTLSGDAKATHAGTYKTVVTLKDGYTWADGSTDAKTVEWSITKRALAASVDDSTVMQGSSSKPSVTVEGFVEGENESNAVGYKSPTLTGLPSVYKAGESYEVGLEGGSADDYYFAELKSGTVKVSTLEVGTYTVTANLSMPGAYNPVLPGTTVYANNPDNPFPDKNGNVPVLDGNASTSVDTGLPSKALSMNAKLVVGKDGTKTLVLPVSNPVFTLQSLGTCDELESVWVERKTPANLSVWDYDKYQTRISKVGVELTDDSDSGTVTYNFKDSTFYAVPLRSEISPSGDIALQLTVNYDEIKQESDSTIGVFTKTNDDGSSLGELTKIDTDGLIDAISKAQSAVKSYSVSKDGSDVESSKSWVSQSAVDTLNAAITEAQKSIGSTDQTEVDEATSTLNAAISSFKASVKPGTKKVEENKKDDTSGKPKPGMYTVTANLYVPGELNTQIPGTTAYLTNPNNPLGIQPNNYSGTISSKIPNEPASNNAKLVVGEDGSLTLTLDVVNPVFTLQAIDGASNATITNRVRDSETYATTDGSVSRTGRIQQITVKLNDKSGEYIFTDCVEFPTLLGVEWKVPLTLGVDLSAIGGSKGDDGGNTGTSVSFAKLNAAIVNAQNLVAAARISADGSDVNALDTWVTQSAVNTLNAAIAKAQGYLTNGDQAAVDAAASELNAAAMEFSKSAQNGKKIDSSANDGKNNGNTNTADNKADSKTDPTKGDVIPTTESGHYAAGTYTVSGNIWLPKSSTGLPLNPHLSNSGFPPKDAVSSNATMVVDASGHAIVYIPIVIQSKVMTVNSISGGVSYSGGTAVIDLGYPTAGQTSFSGTCTVSVTIGDLAMTIGSGIFQGVRDHTYTANWEVALGGASNSGGGGTMPASALAILAGVEGTTDTETAKNAALAALEAEEAEAAEAESAEAEEEAAEEENASPVSAVANTVSRGVKAAEKAVEEAYQSSPGLVIGGTAVAAAGLASLVWFLVGKRKKKDDEEESN